MDAQERHPQPHAWYLELLISYTRLCAIIGQMVLRNSKRLPPKSREKVIPAVTYLMVSLDYNPHLTTEDPNAASHAIAFSTSLPTSEFKEFRHHKGAARGLRVNAMSRLAECLYDESIREKFKRPRGTAELGNCAEFLPSLRSV